MLYSEFGGDADGAYPSDNGFEEWGVELYDIAYPGIKTGMKFEDLNGNGQYDPGEPGLGDWQIAVYDASGGEVAGTFTNSTGPYTGTYTFTLRAGVTYTVCEVLQDGWGQSYPAAVGVDLADCSGYNYDDVHYGSVGYVINLGENETDDGNDFGNYRNATKYGYKWHDLNADGAWDADEPGLNGWTICATDGKDTWCDTTADDAQGDPGYYELSVPPGTYDVYEECPTDATWYQSFPAPVDGCGTGIYEDEVFQSGTSYGPNNFGNFGTADKSGRKFEDLEADGPDTNDPSLDGWTIRAYQDVDLDGVLKVGHTLVATTTTQGGGAYTLDLEPGDYIICEVQQEGWQQSYPMALTEDTADCSAVEGLGHWGYAINLESSDQELNNDFGNYRQAKVRACKYSDLDESGTRDAGEPGLSGWEICLGSNCKLTQESDGCTALWYVEPGSDYELCETLKEGWENTDPGDGLCKQTGQLVSGQAETLEFGNYQPQVVGGATVAPRDIQILLLRLAAVALTGLLALCAGLILWRREATR